jgi:hypothetical protein
LEINLGNIHAAREFLLQLHTLDEVWRESGKPDEPVHSERGAGGHAKRR